MLLKACSNTPAETLSRDMASPAIEAAKENTASALAADVVLVAVLNAAEVMVPLELRVRAESRSDLWILILVPDEPLLLVYILMVWSS